MVLPRWHMGLLIFCQDVIYTEDVLLTTRYSTSISLPLPNAASRHRHDLAWTVAQRNYSRKDEFGFVITRLLVRASTLTLLFLRKVFATVYLQPHSLSWNGADGDWTKIINSFREFKEKKIFNLLKAQDLKLPSLLSAFSKPCSGRCIINRGVT